MTLNFQYVIEKHEINIRGIIQLGAHYWEERDYFISMGVKDFVLVEPQKHCIQILELKKDEVPEVNVEIYPCALSENEGVGFMFCDENNMGQSSSLLRPKDHKVVYPEIPFNRTEAVNVKMLQNLPIDWPKYNVIYMDLQGAELLAMRGAGEILRGIDAVHTEINFREMYEGCGLVGELDAFFMIYGLYRVETGADQGGWTDALYVKRKA